MTIPKEKRYGQQSLTPVCRLIFGDVYNPTQVKGQGAFKFRVTVVCKPVGDLFEGLKKEVNRLIDINFKANVEAGDRVETPLVPCEKLKAFKDRPEYRGLWVIKASANPEYPPKIVAENGLVDATPGLIYPGCYVRLSLNPYAFSNMSVGVSLGLQGINFVKHGKRIGGGVDPEEQFASVRPSQEELEFTVGEDNEGDDIPF